MESTTCDHTAFYDVSMTFKTIENDVKDCMDE